MRQHRANSGDRSNALWGRGSRGELRSNALWGRGGRRAGVAVAALTSALAFAGLAAAAGGGSSGAPAKAFVAQSIVSAIQQNPAQSLDVIVEGDKQGTSNGLYAKL